MITNLDFRRTI